MRLPDSFFLHNLPRGISVTVYKCIVYGKQKHRGFQGKETMQGCAPTSWRPSPSSSSSSPSPSPSVCVSRSSKFLLLGVKKLRLGFRTSSVAATNALLHSYLHCLPYLQTDRISAKNLKNIHCVCSYDPLFWSRENCSILRRRNKLIKSRTDHKRTVKWQPVWFGNLQLKLFLPLFKGCKVSTLVKCNAFSPFGKLCQFEFKILTKLFCSMSFDAWTSQEPIPVSPLGLDLRCGALQCICKRWFFCKNTFCKYIFSKCTQQYASFICKFIFYFRWCKSMNGQ